MIQTVKATPFGSHFAAKLEGANHKLVCALSTATTCSDDTTRPRPILDPWGGEPAEALPHEP